jgi:hypothetical protein
MKIARSTVVFALISSFLVLGLDSQNAASPQQQHQADDLSRVSAVADDIWTDDKTVRRHGDQNQRDTLSVSEQQRTVVQNSGTNVDSSLDNERSKTSLSNENVIFKQNTEPEVVPDVSKVDVVKAPRPSSPKSVIRTNKHQKMAPIESRDPLIPSHENSDQQDIHPSPLSQLSKREREQLLKNLEASFLNIVGLKSRPRPNSDVTVPQYMLELYKQHLQSNEGRRSPSKYRRGLHNSNTIRSFFHTGWYT